VVAVRYTLQWSELHCVSASASPWCGGGPRAGPHLNANDWGSNHSESSSWSVSTVYSSRLLAVPTSTARIFFFQGTARMIRAAQSHMGIHPEG
jgi:hypothetical protein